MKSYLPASPETEQRTRRTAEIGYSTLVGPATAMGVSKMITL